MKEIEKVFGKIKYLVEDFIVEEIGEDWNCSVSREFLPNAPADFGNLDLDDSRDFLWGELEKQNLDHFQAIKDLARGIGKGVDAIGYAGTKDKVAWTCQRISIFKPNVDFLKNFRHPNLMLKNFKWAKRKIKLGYLEANRFKIVIRDVDKKSAVKIVNKIRGLGWFPNYFGVQRFGSMRGNNAKIGKLILKRDFEGAVLAILTDLGNENQECELARMRLKNEKNFLDAAKYFPIYLRLERQILDYLSRKPADFIGVLKCAERKNILMFVHAIQSKIFNEILLRAIEEGLDFTKKGQQNCLLIGYKSRFSDGRLGEIEREVLADNGLELEDFDVREIPYLRIKGSFRKAITVVENLEAGIEDDDIFSGSKKIVLSFVLPSGVYATTFLGEFFDFI